MKILEKFNSVKEKIQSGLESRNFRKNEKSKQILEISSDLNDKKNKILKFGRRSEKYSQFFENKFGEFFDESGNILNEKFPEVDGEKGTLEYKRNLLEKKKEHFENIQYSAKFEAEILGILDGLNEKSNFEEIKSLKEILKKVKNYKEKVRKNYFSNIKIEKKEGEKTRFDKIREKKAKDFNLNLDLSEKNLDSIGKPDTKEKFGNFFSLNKHFEKKELEESGVDVNNYNSKVGELTKNFKRKIMGLVTIGVLGAGSVLYNQGSDNNKNLNTDTSGNDQNKTVKVVKNIDNNESNILVDQNNTIEIKNSLKDINTSTKYLQPILTKDFLSGLKNNYGINILNQLKIKDPNDKEKLTKNDIKNLKKLQRSYFKNPGTANGVNFGKNSLEGLKIYLGYEKNQTWILKPKPVTVKVNNFLELEKNFKESSYNKFFDNNGTFNLKNFNTFYKDKLKDNSVTQIAFKIGLSKYKTDSKLQAKVNKILNALNTFINDSNLGQTCISDLNTTKSESNSISDFRSPF